MEILTMPNNLSKLTIEVRPDINERDPFLAAKSALAANLEKQLLSAKAMVEGKPCPEVKRKWYLRVPDGTIRFRLRVGSSVMDFGDGKTDITVQDEKGLPKAIETVIAALRDGELDDPIRKVIAERKPRSKRKAAA